MVWFYGVETFLRIHATETKPFNVINLPQMYVILKYKANIFVFYFNLLFLLKIFYGKKSNYSKIIR